MKKISLLLVAIMIMASFCLISCDNGNKTPSATTPASTATATTAEPTTATTTTEPTTATATATPENEVAAISGVDPAAYAAMKAAFAKVDLEDSYKNESLMSAISSADGTTIEIKTKKTICINNALTPDKTTASKLSETSMFGITGKENVYYENGYAYYTAGEEEGGNYKTPAGISVILGSSDENLESIGFDEKQVEASKLISNADGSSKILIRLNKDALLGNSTESGVAGTLSDDSYFYLTLITDKDGRPSSYTVETKTAITNGAVSSSSIVTLQMTYSYDNVVVTAPEGYESYEEQVSYFE